MGLLYIKHCVFFQAIEETVYMCEENSELTKRRFFIGFVRLVCLVISDVLVKGK